VQPVRRSRCFPGDPAGVSPSRTYGSAGTRTVTLTVTDNNGARGSTTRQVTVSPVNPGVVAADAFNRTIANGWGSADTGGPGG